MPDDFDILTDGELMVAHIEAQNDDAAEVVDAFNLPGGAVVAVDSGRIIIPLDKLDVFRQTAEKAGYTCPAA